MSEDEILHLASVGHDCNKVYNAYYHAVNTKGQPTVILAQTVKGYGLGPTGEAVNNAHQVKKLDVEALKTFRDRFNIPIADEELDKIPDYRPPADSAERIGRAHV